MVFSHSNLTIATAAANDSHQHTAYHASQNTLPGFRFTMDRRRLGDDAMEYGHSYQQQAENDVGKKHFHDPPDRLTGK